MIFKKSVGHMICGDERPLNCIVINVRRYLRVYVRLRTEVLQTFPFAPMGDKLKIIASFFIGKLLLPVNDPATNLLNAGRFTILPVIGSFTGQKASPGHRCITNFDDVSR